MVELGIRLGAAAIAAAGAWWLRLPETNIIGNIAAVSAAYSVFVALLERRGLRSSGVASVIGVVDSLIIASLLGAANRLDTFGFLVLAPVAYAASRFGALPTSMAPVAAGSLVAAHTLFSKAATPSLMLGFQAAGILGLGLLLNHRRIVVTVAQPVLPDPIEPLSESSPDETLELRESFRKLKEIYGDLEQRSRRDRLAVSLFEARHTAGERFFKALAIRLRDITGSESLALYTMAQFSDRMVVRGVSGDYPTSIRDASVDVDVRHAARQIADNALGALKALTFGDDQRRLVNVLLKSEGRVVGMLCLGDSNPDRLAEALEVAEELSEAAANLILDETRRLAYERRMREAELLYEISGNLTGAKTPTQLASRAARESWESLDVDSLSVWFVDDKEAILAANQGANLKLLEAMSFSAGPGLQGWIETGSPELVLFDTNEDNRVNPQEALKRRVGSFILIPIQFGDKPYGYITCASHRAGGLDLDEVETLRSLAAELTHAIARMEGADLEGSGLATPGELQDAITSGAYGHLVYLEPARRIQMLEQFGKPVFENAIRQFARKLRAKLPANSLVCRRAEGDYVVLLRGVSHEFAVSWANEMCALASFIGIKTPDIKNRIPLALKAKVADLNSQKRQFLHDSVA